MLPALRGRLRSGDQRFGGVLSYPLERLYEEVAYIAYYFHWPVSQVMAMEHVDRLRWVTEIAKMNKRINDESDGGGSAA